MATQGWADAMLHQPKDLIEVSQLLYDPPPQSRSLSAEERGRKLVQAAEEGEVGELRALIAAGANVGTRGQWGWTALHWAADRGDAEAARLLVEAGAAVDARDVSGYTPLHYASVHGRAEVAAQLLDAGADRWATTGGGETALHLARRYKHRRLVKMLS
ncbi:ankyrin repeat domain-containing protein 65-like [Schistocerca serialis cubense]|uniref:ankyrin repeat domain-containing protein 65-like n=1 Tax=Schistocerca serialis cubense TaxID=2023355 RepID=UPI00214E0CF3|nr:ankyrin repeat domain-containing protein 65-like [Schistocerca serialis cubense]